LLIGVCVHEINTAEHPDQPPGWRWAVHVGTQWGDMKTCLNAGWEQSRQTAGMAGEAAAVVGAGIAVLCGERPEVRTWQLSYDPQPPMGLDVIRMGV
jgi:hypothetical protein